MHQTRGMHGSSRLIINGNFFGARVAERKYKRGHGEEKFLFRYSSTVPADDISKHLSSGRKTAGDHVDILNARGKWWNVVPIFMLICGV